MKLIVNVVVIAMASISLGHGLSEEGMMIGDDSEMMDESKPEMKEGSRSTMMGGPMTNNMDMDKLKMDKNDPLYVTYMALAVEKTMMRVARVNLFMLESVRKVLTVAEAKNLEDMRGDIANLYRQFFEFLTGMQKGPMDVDRLMDIYTRFMDKASGFRNMLTSYVMAEMTQSGMEMGEKMKKPAMESENKGQKQVEKGMEDTNQDAMNMNFNLRRY